MGKYDDVLPKLPALPVADRVYQNKVQAVKDALITDPTFELRPTNLGREYSLLRAEKARVEEELYGVNMRIEAIAQLLIETQQVANPEWGQYGKKDNTLLLVTGDKFEVRKEPAAKVENKEAFRLWCVNHCQICGEDKAAHTAETGHEPSTLEGQLQLWPSTTAAIAKELLVQGQEPPDGVSVYQYTKIVFTAFKPGKGSGEAES